MAGDWIPITIDLAQRREVALMAQATGMNRHEILGRLADFWGWASRETEDGVLRNVSVATCVTTLELQESFIRALIDVHWLLETPEGLVISNWERWLSNGAKARLGNALRQKIYRGKRAKNVATNVATKALPEKRREEKSNNTPIVPKGTCAYPECFEQFWNTYPPLRRSAKQAAYRAYKKSGKKLRSAGRTSAEAVAYLQAQAEAFAQSPKGQSAYCPMPATWLNQGYYDDAPDAWQRGDDESKTEKPQTELPYL